MTQTFQTSRPEARQPQTDIGLGAGLGRLLRLRYLRYGLVLLAAGIVLVLALGMFSSALVARWSRDDIELRAHLIDRSVSDAVARLTAAPDRELPAVFEREAEYEQALALGFCAADGTMHFASRLMPKSLSCATLPLGTSDSFALRTVDGTHVQIGVFPLKVGSTDGHLLVLHDLTGLDNRAARAELLTMLALACAMLGLGGMSALVAVIVMRFWSRATAVARKESSATPIAEALPRKESPISREFQALMRELRLERKFTDGIYVEWSPKTLRQLLAEELPGVEVLVVSNREPYIHNKSSDGTITLQLPASGLVSALEPVMRSCGGTWIAHGSGSADHDTVDSDDHIRVPPAKPEYTLRRVWLSDEELGGYYLGFANEGLWPLCHIAFVRPIFRDTDWAHYKAVNEKFADIVVAEAGREDPIVLVQDYHLALLPRLIRNRLPKATIITFWHIPWPNAETFGICPWREEIIDGLLGSSILGFHTRQHCNNFLEATDRFMESRIDREQNSVTLGGQDTLIRDYPISIEWPPTALATQASIADCRSALRARLGLPEDIFLGVGIERFDYTKGIPDRFLAVDEFLTRYPDWKGKFAFVQAAAPSRSSLGAYSELQAETERLAEEINARHQFGGWKPIHLVIRHHDQREVYELFRAADLCIVSSLHDGMNLVAKEFVAARDDERGVLILSSFAGASRELGEALIVNPYDITAMAMAISTALAMPLNEQQDRLSQMRETVSQHNVYRWAAQMLVDAARIRRRESIRAQVTAPPEPAFDPTDVAAASA